MAVLFKYNAANGFIPAIPARDITDEDPIEWQAIAEINSKYENACFTAVAAVSAQPRTGKAKADPVEDKSG